MSTDAPLPDDPELLKAMVAELLATLAKKDRRVDQLEHQLDLLLRRLYRPRRERQDPNQPTLFDLDEPVQEQEQADEATTQPEHESNRAKRRPHGRRALPAILPRQRVEHGLLPHELACPCCGDARIRIGEETSEQLEYEPASLYVVEHVRFKYACRRCQEQVTLAPKPPQPIEKGLAGPGLLAWTAVSKYGDHLPLYRLEEILGRHGLSISRSTTCGWMRQTAELLLPLYERLKAEVLILRVIHTDDTPVPVLDATLPKTRTGRFWIYCGDTDHPYSVYDYTPSRKRDGPAEFLAGYRGYLQADAYGGYDGIYLESSDAIVEVACWAHARRKFFDAKSTASRHAREALSRIGQLYAIERKTQEKQLSFEQVLALRQKKAVPLLAGIRDWLDSVRESVLPKSPIGQATSYALSNWDALCRYCEAGYLSIDNNLAERTLRPCAIGRKNWLFAGNDQGGRTAAVFFTMIASAKANGVDPYRWLRAVLTDLPGLTASRPIEPAALSALLPDRWLAAHPAAALPVNRQAETV